LLKLTTSADLAPMGPSANLKKAKITSNPKIHTKVDKIVSDFDLKSVNALTYLYKSGFDENFLSKLLSVGTLGKKLNRKLVPTRWSITATDDTLCKELLKEIKNYNVADYQAYFGNYLGNYYLFLFFSEPWSYELFETYPPRAYWNPTEKTNFTTDFENFFGRKNYAEQCSGGYYTVRLAIAEKLKQLKRQASVLALRFISGDYAVPLGVWITRQSARRALQSKPIKFASKKLMLTYAKHLIKRKFNYDLDLLTRQSKLLKEVGKQKRLVLF